MDGPCASLVTPMFKLSIARVEDFNKLLPMAQKFYENHPHAATMGFDMESAYKLFLDMVEHGFIVVAWENDEPTGMLAMMVGPFVLNNNYKVATEILWWVSPEYRQGRRGLLMLKMAEELAKIDGCHSVTMSSLTVGPEGVDKVYRHRGYIEMEKSFVKEL